MNALKFTRFTAIALTLFNAVLWTYQGHRLVGVCIALVAVAAAKWLPEE